MTEGKSLLKRASIGASCVAATTLVLSGSVAFRGASISAAAGPRTSTHAAAGTLVLSTVSKTLWVRTMDPAVVTDLTSANVMSKVYAGLLKQAYNDKTKMFDIVPDLAQALPTVSHNNTVYTFKLRPGLTFSDGTPLTSADVVHSILRSLDPKAYNGGTASPVSYYLAAIKGQAAYSGGKSKTLPSVSAPNASTVVVTLSQPTSYFLYAFTYPTSYVLKKSVPVGAKLTTTPSLVIGSGPFMLRNHSWQYNKQMTLVPNPHYYNASKIKVKEIDIPFVGTVGGQFTAYQAGQYPTSDIPSILVRTYQSKPEFHNTPVLGTVYYCMNAKYKPFNSKNFRLAVAYAINRDAIVNGVLKGTAQKLNGWYPQGILGYDGSLTTQVPYYNPTKAKAYLAAAQKQLGSIPTISLEYPSDNEDTGRVALQVQSDLKAVGITMSVKPVPGNTWLADGVAQKTPFILSDWYDDYPDPQDFSDYLLRTAAGENFGGYSNPTVDKLFDQGNTSFDTATRARIYKQAQLIALNDGNNVMLYQIAAQGVISTKIHGMELNPSWASDPQPISNDWSNVTVSS